MKNSMDREPSRLKAQNHLNKRLSRSTLLPTFQQEGVVSVGLLGKGSGARKLLENGVDIEVNGEKC